MTVTRANPVAQANTWPENQTLKKQLKVEGDLRHDGTKFGVLGTLPNTKAPNVADPAGGATVDVEARAAIADILDILERYGLMAP